MSPHVESGRIALPGAGRLFSKVDSGWAAFVFGIVGLKLVLFALDPIPKFFFGDSGWYLGTAFMDMIPVDRSFTYGYLIRLLSFGSRSFTPLLVSQVLAGAAVAILLAYSLKKHFSVGSGVACAAGFLCAVEPIQLLYEREVMTEAFSLFYFALYMVSAFEYLSGRRLGRLCVAQILGTALLSLRVSFLPVVLANAVVLPLVASFVHFRENGPGGESAGSRSGPAAPKWLARPGAFLGVHLLVSLCFTFALHAGYKQVSSKITGCPPAYNAAGGFFLASIWAPVVEPVDFPHLELRDEVFGGLLYDLKDRSLRNEHNFADGGLADRIRRVLPGPAGNKAASETAMNALRRDPLAVMVLSLQTLGDYFNLEILREKILNDLGMDAEGMQLYADWQLDCGEFMEFPGPVGQPQADTWTRAYYRLAVPWYWFLIFSPVPAGAALFFARNAPAALAPRIAVFLAVCACAAVACFLTVFPVVRYLHPVSWLVFFPIACLVGGGKGSGRWKN
ncbi:MAG: hypothetical protein ABFD98_01060 [Syntrophobacteraceae bacterium]